MRYKIYITNGGNMGLTIKDTSLTNIMFDSLAEAKTYCLDRWVNNKISMNNITGEYRYKNKKYPSYEDYVMSMTLVELAENVDFNGELRDIELTKVSLKEKLRILDIKADQWKMLAWDFDKEVESD
tara:strand:+ start:1015 stop:1392 length:378 start_codon:yes stop_codon:yes gene_type:complete